MRLALIILPALAAVSACGDEAANKGPERTNAAGEILGGEVSDDMLPLDTVRSTSPAGESEQSENNSTPAPGGRAKPPERDGTAAEAPPAEPSASPEPQGTQGA